MKSISNNELETEFIDWPVHMQRALQLAENVITAAPNPRVGCVIVKRATTVGEGWHVAAGQAHAEVMALQSAAKQSASATVFVSLEPCSHTGRTGPCVDALIEAGVARVVVAAIDPNPDVSGAGIDRLESAGIDVFQLTDFTAASRAINLGYFKRREEGLPWVRCKMAMSLDGRTALANGDSKWITGTAARSDVQMLRASSSAVITGIGTVLADDPSLNVRPSELNLSRVELEQNKMALSLQPLRVILDSQLRTPGTAKILSEGAAVKIFTANKIDSKNAFASHVEILETNQGQPQEAGAQRVNLHFVLESLASDYSCNEVLLEAGSTLSGAFIQAGLVDEIIVYIAPILLGRDSRALLDITGLQSLSDSISFEIKDLTKVGKDIRVIARPIVSS